jgi:hypothetical protein
MSAIRSSLESMVSALLPRSYRGLGSSLVSSSERYRSAIGARPGATFLSDPPWRIIHENRSPRSQLET